MPLRDRGTIKWNSIMLPEHVYQLKEALRDEKKVQKPILDEHEIEQMEMFIIEALKYNFHLIFTLYVQGYTREITGKPNFIDHIKKNLKIQDEKNQIHFVAFTDLIKVQKL